MASVYLRHVLLFKQKVKGHVSHDANGTFTDME